MKLVLFDIDGTLLKTDGLGRRATAYALETVFGSAGNLDNFYPGGRTQEAIFRDTLADLGITGPRYSSKREMLYGIFLEASEKGLQTGESRVVPLPGALELVEELSRENGLLLGLVTGNHARNAYLKLEAAGFDPQLFKVLGSGELSPVRGDLVRIAMDRAGELIGKLFAGPDTVVIGDTARDVASTRTVGALSIAVSTGTDTPAQLREAGPDWLLERLPDRKTFMQMLGE